VTLNSSAKAELFVGVSLRASAVEIEKESFRFTGKALIRPQNRLRPFELHTKKHPNLLNIRLFLTILPRKKLSNYFFSWLPCVILKGYFTWANPARHVKCILFYI